MSQHSSARAAAESRFEKLRKPPEAGSEAKAEHVARDEAVSANTARLKELRLEKERADREAPAAVTPPRKKPRAQP